jgi:putative GTP pyrophosphokinase
MSETEFLKRFQLETPQLKAWGNYVNSEIKKALSEVLVNNPIKDTFLRIDPKPRLKDEKSILAKAFLRGKQYKDPYQEITDKIGIRYVVLLLEHIRTISNIIEQGGQWVYSLDRDFEREKVNYPYFFDYQSVHYVLRNKSALIYDGITILKEIPCEVQIRTLLQHACSELTHDTIYKKEPTQNTIVYRSIAKSRALTEAADDIFSGISTILAEESKNMIKLLNDLLSLYSAIGQPDYDEKSSVFILSAIDELTNNTDIEKVRSFVFIDNPGLPKIISEKSKYSFLYRQPIILLLYYLVKYQREKLKTLWPLPPTEIQPLFNDLGIALNANT